MAGVTGETCPVITVLIEGNSVVINESDFNPDVHTRADGATKESTMTVVQLKEQLTKMGIAIPKDAPKAKLIELYTTGGL